MHRYKTCKNIKKDYYNKCLFDMNILASDLKGNWYKNGVIIFAFYPQDPNSKKLKCSININNEDQLIYNGEIQIEENVKNNSYTLKAGDLIFEIEGINATKDSMLIYSADFGKIEVDKK